MDHVKIRAAAHAMGLSERTVEDLLRKGWVYSETLGKPRTWTGPEINFEEPK